MVSSTIKDGNNGSSSVDNKLSVRQRVSIVQVSFPDLKSGIVLDNGFLQV